MEGEGEVSLPATEPWMKDYGVLNVIPWPWRRKHFPSALYALYGHVARTRWSYSPTDRTGPYGRAGEVRLTLRQLAGEMGYHLDDAVREQRLLVQMGLLVKRSARGRSNHYMIHPWAGFNGGPTDQIMIMSELMEKDPTIPADIIELKDRILSVVTSNPDGPKKKKAGQSDFIATKSAKPAVRLVTDPASEDLSNIMLAHWRTSRFMEGTTA